MKLRYHTTKYHAGCSSLSTKDAYTTQYSVSGAVHELRLPLCDGRMTWKSSSQCTDLRHTHLDVPKLSQALLGRYGWKTSHVTYCSSRGILHAPAAYTTAILGSDMAPRLTILSHNRTKSGIRLLLVDRCIQSMYCTGEAR